MLTKRSTRAILATLSVSFIIISLFGCGFGSSSGGTVSNPVGPNPFGPNLPAVYEYTLNPNTIDTANSNLVLAGVSSTTYTFTTTSVNPIKPGSIIIGYENGGFLKKAKTVSVSGNSVSVQTEDATIDEAFEHFRFSFKGKLSEISSITAQLISIKNPGGVGQATFLKTSIRHIRSAVQGERLDDGMDPLLSVKLDYFSHKWDPVVEWDCDWGILSPNSYRFILDGPVEISTGISFRIQAGKTVSLKKELFHSEYFVGPGTFLIGIPLELKFHPKLSGFYKTGFKTSFNLRWGVIEKKGEPKQWIKEQTEAKYEFPEPDQGGKLEAELEASAGFEFGYKIFGVLGVKAGVEFFFKLLGEFNEVLRVKVTLGVRGTISLVLEAWTINFLGVKNVLFEYEVPLWEKTFDNVAPNKPTIVIPTNGQTGLVIRPNITGDPFSERNVGNIHSKSDWEIYSKSTLFLWDRVWNKMGDTLNKTSLTVSSENGTFENSLTGKDQLETNSDYWVRVRYFDNNGAASDWSEAVKFTTGSATVNNGILAGTVKDAVAKTALSGATIKVYSQGGSLLTTLVSDANGNYSTTLVPASGYRVECSKDGYLSVNYEGITIDVGVTKTLETILQIDTQHSGGGTVSGKITDSTTGAGIGNVTINLRRGINVSSGTIVKTATTDTAGNYHIVDLDAGQYTGEAIKANYVTGYFTITSIGGLTTGNQNGSVSPANLTGEGIRIQLTWGENPSDLDSHLTGPDGAGGRFHVYFSNQSFSFNNEKIADLDVDDTTSYGPETVTIYKQISGVYRYSVHDYTNAGTTAISALANSGAKVVVYRGNQIVNTFNVPNSPGTLWTVFEVTGNTITAINTMSYEGDAGNIKTSILAVESKDETRNDGNLMINLPKKMAAKR